MKIDKVGDKYSDYRVTKITKIEELYCNLIELVHEPTGAKIVYIQNDDVENVFCLSFQTTPHTSNGVAHILEHTVLCGSKKFPVKDPFFSMSRRSLNTYMNALTGQDFTCYPAASQIKQDFYNLLEVYLDAVFHPILDLNSFYQEGHRLEFQEEENPHTPLVYKGIVYNEMKGALASASSRNHEALYAALFPDITYGVNSGGDPREIPQLTYDELLKFHKEYYHPSRCLFFFYGNIPLNEHLDFISKEILNHCTPAPPLPPIPVQPRFDKPRYIENSYPASEEEVLSEQIYVSFGWLTVNITEQKTILALSILESALLENDASPLRYALLLSGLCTQVSSYVDTEISEVPFVINLRGCKKHAIEVLEETLFSSLKVIVEHGLDPLLVDNAMHQLEFHRSEITGDHYPFGLTLFMRSALLTQHHVDSEKGIVIHQLFEEINKERAKNPRFFEELIQTYLISNTHFVRLVMLPDAELITKENALEEKILQNIQKKLSKEEKEQLIQKAKELKTYQEEQDTNVDILPKLRLKEVPKECKIYDLEIEKSGNLEIYYHETFTNSIIYADLTWPLPKIPSEYNWILKFYTVLATQLGNHKRSYLENLQYIEGCLGGLHTSLSIHTSATDVHSCIPSFHIHAKALHNKAKPLFEILKDVAINVDLSDKVRIKEVFLKHYTLLQTSLSQSSLKYAISVASSGNNAASKLGDVWFGLEYYQCIKNYALNYDTFEEDLLQKLADIKNLLIPTTPHLILTCDRQMFAHLKEANFYGLTTLKNYQKELFEANLSVEKVKTQAKLVSTPVAFIAKSFPTVPYTHPDSPALNIAAQLFDNVTLHSTLREQGGAYGGGASLNSLSGNFLFYSYRDPNIVSSLDAFLQAVKVIEKEEFTENDLIEAKMEILQGMDAPISPGSRGEAAYCWLMENKSTKLRQQYRDILIKTTKADIVKAIKKHLLPSIEKATTIVFCGKELLEKENQKLIEAKTPPLQGVII